MDAELEEVRRKGSKEIPTSSDRVVVEDEETVQKLAVILLKVQGHPLLEPPDGSRRLSYVRSILSRLIWSSRMWSLRG